MADLALLVPSQLDNASTTLEDIHVCATGRTEQVTVFICNRAGATTFRLAVAIGGAADNLKQYLYYDTVLPANDTLQVQLTLNTADVVRVYTGTTTVSTNVFIDASQKLAG